MIPPPSFQCREQVSSAAVLAAVGVIGDCAPDDSDVAVTNLTACSSIYAIWLAFINQIKVAFCYIFGKLVDIQNALEAIQSELPSAHVGTPTVLIDPTFEANYPGSSVALVSGSDDVRGTVIVTAIGMTGPTSNEKVFTLTFGAQFDNEIFPQTSQTTHTAGLPSLFCNARKWGATGGPYTHLDFAADILVASSGSDIFYITYNVLFEP